MTRKGRSGRRPVVYVLECADGKLYTGASVDLEKRMRAHEEGTAARFTRARRPVRLLAWWYPKTYAVALSQEARFKALDRGKKLAVLGGDRAFGLPVHRVRARARRGK